MYATLLDDPEMINRQLGRYLAVTAADIQRVAAEVLRPDNRVVLTYMPATESASGAKNEETAA
jgi:predicted Zn-dependent peptidase